MELRVSKEVNFLIFIFLMILFMLSTNIVYAGSINDYQGRVKEYKNNKTNSTNNVQSLSISNNIVDSENCYVDPSILSSGINKINYMSFYLRDENDNEVTGIKVNRIDIFQNGNKIVSTTDVKSYSAIGRYVINDAELLGNFLNSNGENNVDIVFYLFNKEVTRIENFTINIFSNKIVSNVWPTNIGFDTLKLPNEVTILNAGENDIVDVWLEDETGNKVTEYDGQYDSWYNNEDKELTVYSKLSFKNSSYLVTDKEYYIVVDVNGEKLEFVNDWNEIYLDSESWVYLSYWPEDEGKYYYHVGGINLLTKGPYTLEITQNGEVTGSIGNISATLEDDYFEMINQEITGLLNSPGEQYTTFLYDNYGSIVDEETWMEPVDEIEEDVIIPDDPTNTATPIVQIGINSQDGNAAGIFVGLKDIKDTQGNIVTDARLTAYQIEIDYDPTKVAILKVVDEAKLGRFTKEINLAAKKVIVTDQGSNGTTSFNKLFFLPITLTGSALDLSSLQVKYLSLSDENLDRIGVENPSDLVFRRGKIYNEGSNKEPNINDAVAGLQYLAGHRNVGVDLEQINPINMASIYGEDTAIITPNVKDVIALMQYLNRLRNATFQLVSNS